MRVDDPWDGTVAHRIDLTAEDMVHRYLCLTHSRMG